MRKLSTFDKLKEIIRLNTQENLSQRQIARIIGCGRTTVQDFLLKKTHKDFWDNYTDNDNTEKESVDAEENLNFDCNKMYVVCCAQSNGYAQSNFLKSIKTFCKENDAKLLISSFKHNSSPKDTEIYDSALEEYICNNRVILAKDLIFCGELDISPTNVTPCNLFKNYGGDISIIIPHVKQDLLCLPSDKGLFKKNIFSTGCITEDNYKINSLGYRSAENHVLGALIVCVDENGISNTRQIQCMDDSGEFYDLDVLYTPDRAIHGQSVEAINWGDIHAIKIDNRVADLSWRSHDSLLDTLKPKYQFVHDIFDMNSRNHHNRSSQSTRLMLAKNNNSSVEKEIEFTCELLKEFSRPFSTVVVVESNHDKALEKWLEESNPDFDDVNARYYHKLKYAYYTWIEEEYKKDERFQVFKYACLDKYDFTKDGYIFLKDNEPFIICGNINCGQHGDKGNNGARGSVAAYRIRSSKYNIGHVHSPQILGRVFASGVSGLLFMGYNNGADAWRHAHIITYKNGARSIIFI